MPFKPSAAYGSQKLGKKGIFFENHIPPVKIIILTFWNRQARHNKSLVDVVALPAISTLFLIGMYLIYSFSRATGKKKYQNITRSNRIFSQVCTIIFFWTTAGEFMQQMYNWTIMGCIHGILGPIFFPLISFKDTRRNISRIFHSYILCRPFDCT